MTTYYLMDMHVADVANSRIVDVIGTPEPTSEIRVDGLTPIKVPDGVRVVNPTSLADILTQKYAGILALYPGFSNIVFDDLLDPGGLETTTPSTTYMKKSGSRGTVGGMVQTLLTDPNMDVSPTVISQCIVVYETYTWRYVDPKNGRFERYYIEEPEVLHTVNVSVNGGVNFTPTTSGSLVTFALTQGSVIQLKFSGDAVNNRLLHTGSWAVIY